MQFEWKAMSEWLSEGRSPGDDPRTEGWFFSGGALRRPDVLGKAKRLDLNNDSASYMRAKLWPKRNQRMVFLAPQWIRDYLKSNNRPHEGALINGVFCGVLKIGPNPKNEFFRGYSITGLKHLDWLIVLRDVMIKTKDDESMFWPLRNRKVNKKRTFEFSLTEILADSKVVYTSPDQV